MCAGNGHLLRVEPFISARRYSYYLGHPTNGSLRINLSSLHRASASGSSAVTNVRQAAHGGESQSWRQRGGTLDQRRPRFGPEKSFGSNG
jgi:hypothetical protein